MEATPSAPPLPPLANPTRKTALRPDWIQHYITHSHYGENMRPCSPVGDNWRTTPPKTATLTASVSTIEVLQSPITMTTNMSEGVEFNLSEHLLVLLSDYDACDDPQDLSEPDDERDASQDFSNFRKMKRIASIGHNLSIDQTNSDFAGDAMDAAVSVSSFCAKGCYGEYARMETPSSAANEELLASAEFDDQFPLAVPTTVQVSGDPEVVMRLDYAQSWRDMISEQILVGLGFKTVDTTDHQQPNNTTPSDAPGAEEEEEPIKDEEYPERFESERSLQEDDRETLMLDIAKLDAMREAWDEVQHNSLIEDDTRDEVDNNTPEEETIIIEQTISNGSGRQKKSEALKKLVIKCLAQNKQVSRNKKAGNTRVRTTRKHHEHSPDPPEECEQHQHPKTNTVHRSKGRAFPRPESLRYSQQVQLPVSMCPSLRSDPNNAKRQPNTLSPSAILRRRKYKEMLLQQKAAEKSVLE